MDYQAKLKTPFGVLGIGCTADALTGIDFLASGARPMPPQNPLAREVCEQLTAYFADPAFHFDLPLQPGGTAHQNKVWRAMCAIPCGNTRSYGDVATQLGSSPRAVGQACGNNPIPVIIPCHRIVSKAGLGGFMHHDAGFALDIKRWLLEHEARKKLNMSLIEPLATRLSPQAGKSLVIPRRRESKAKGRSFEERPSSLIKTLDSGSSPE